MEVAKASEPSEREPACQRVHPAGMLRAAEPEPSLAMEERVFWSSWSSAAAAAAMAAAAHPEAEEARPVARGKLL